MVFPGSSHGVARGFQGLALSTPMLFLHLSNAVPSHCRSIHSLGTAIRHHSGQKNRRTLLKPAFWVKFEENIKCSFGQIRRPSDHRIGSMSSLETSAPAAEMVQELKFQEAAGSVLVRPPAARLEWASLFAEPLVGKEKPKGKNKPISPAKMRVIGTI